MPLDPQRKEAFQIGRFPFMITHRFHKGEQRAMKEDPIASLLAPVAA
jgi:hypothetical protein